MEKTTSPDLDERKAAILKAVVEEYVHKAQPVGSGTIARSSGLGVSSATVRNEMTVLEREGYLMQPHTSAGRVPTDRGYRFFVDHFTTDTSALPATQRKAVSEFFASAHAALEELLHETSQLLSNVSKHAAMVVGPPPDAATLRSVQLVSLQPRVVLAVAVLSNGAVEKSVLTLDDDVDDARVGAANATLNRQLNGKTWTRLPEVTTTGDREVDVLAKAARDALVERAGSEPEHFFVGGASRLAAEQSAFETAERASRLLEMLEHQVVVVSLVRELLDRGLTVSIGSENPLDELRDCSIIVAPYEVEGHAAGVVGVLGPTRMDYRHALAAVSAVSQQLGRHLS